MGVTGLLGLLKSIQKPCNLKEFKGQTIGVDAYGWLHRGAVACAMELALGKPTTKFVDFAMHRVRMLLHFGVKPYIVFDGDRLPSKAATEASRADRRQKSTTAGLELLRVGKVSMAYQELQKAVDVTPMMARMLIDELRMMRVDYVVAPYEADSQLAYLESKGFIDAIVSEDSDLLVFGARCLLTKLDQYGECVMVRQADFSSCREVNLGGWTPVEFRRMAILSGCDYLEGIHRMGLKTAYRLVRKYKTVDRIIRGAQLEAKLRIPPRYLEDFRQAEMTFLYQYVFCPEVQQLVNLTTPDTKGQLDGVTYIGAFIEPEVAQQVARGDLDPMSKRPIVVPQQSRHGHKTPVALKHSKSLDSGSAKSIDSFFAPQRRTPLAELDPNSFTPSPSQQRLLHDQANGQSWSTDQAPSQIRSMPNRVPGPNPVKRQRLCSESSDPASLGGQVERSRFFFTSTEPCPSMRPAGSKKRIKKQEADFHIWSDDSVDDAMAKLVDTQQAKDPGELQKRRNGSEAPGSNEKAAENTKKTKPDDLEGNEGSSRLPPLSPGDEVGVSREDHVGETSVTQCGNLEIKCSPMRPTKRSANVPEVPTPFSASLQAEARALRENTNLQTFEYPANLHTPKKATRPKGSEDCLVPESEVGESSEGGSPRVVNTPPVTRTLDLTRFAFA